MSAVTIVSPYADGMLRPEPDEPTPPREAAGSIWIISEDLPRVLPLSVELGVAPESISGVAGGAGGGGAGVAGV